MLAKIAFVAALCTLAFAEVKHFKPTANPCLYHISYPYVHEIVDQNGKVGVSLDCIVDEYGQENGENYYVYQSAYETGKEKKAENLVLEAWYRGDVRDAENLVLRIRREVISLAPREFSCTPTFKPYIDNPEFDYETSEPCDCIDKSKTNCTKYHATDGNTYITNADGRYVYFTVPTSWSPLGYWEQTWHDDASSMDMNMFATKDCDGKELGAPKNSCEPAPPPATPSSVASTTVASISVLVGAAFVLLL